MWRSLLLSCCTLLAGISPAFAEENASGSTPAATAATAPEPLGEITVTAQKRSQKLSDVGISIVSVNDEQLRSAGVDSVFNLPKMVPGFTVGQTFAGYPVFSLRGINFNASQLSAPPAVSTYIDEAALPYPPMTRGLLFDVERVEVLKGPQGTLFGQNSTGGSINVIAAKPTAKMSGGVSTEINNFGQVMLEGFVSGPLSDTLRLRVAGTATEGGAWQKGYYLNHQSNGRQNKAAGRVLLDWTPTDRITISAMLNANYDHSEAQQPQLLILLPSAANNPLLRGGYPLPTSARDADFPLGFNTHMDDHLYQGMLRADVELNDTMTLTSITNYIESRTDTPLNFAGVGFPSIIGSYGGTVHTSTQEARLTGKIPDARINYIVGANYEHDSILDSQNEPLPHYSGLPPNSVFAGNYDLTNRAAAAFGNLDFEVLPKLTITTGVRYTGTKQTAAGCFTGNAATASILSYLANVGRATSGLPPTNAYVAGGCLTIDNVPATPGGTADFLPVFSNLQQTQDNLSWRGGLNYKLTPDDLLYALVSRGYKAGVFPVGNILLQSEIHNVSQERLTSYEMGVKLALFDRRVRLDVAGFYYEYKDKQFFTYVPIPIIGVGATLVNIPKSNEKGIDANITVTPVSGLTLRAGATYIDTRVGEYHGFADDGTPVDFTGKQFNYAPPVSATLDAEYRFELAPRIQSYFGVGGVYNSKAYADLGENPANELPAYTVLDARVGLESETGWRFGLWVRNMTDRYYWISSQLGGDTTVRIVGMPRTYGLSAGYRF
jgi:outer membrane receptor protein involved in Fe transport